MSHKSDVANAFKQFLVDVRADGIPSVVQYVQSDDGGEFRGGEFKQVCLDYGIKQEFTTARTPQLNGVAERGLHLIQEAAMAATIEAPRLFPFATLPSTDDLWAEAMQWAAESLNRTGSAGNEGFYRRTRWFSVVHLLWLCYRFYDPDFAARLVTARQIRRPTGVSA